MSLKNSQKIFGKYGPFFLKPYSHEHLWVVATLLLPVGLTKGVTGVLYLIIKVHKVPLRYRLTLNKKLHNLPFSPNRLYSGSM